MKKPALFFRIIALSQNKQCWALQRPELSSSCFDHEKSEIHLMILRHSSIETSMGLRFVAVLPVHAAGLSHPLEPKKVSPPAEAPWLLLPLVHSNLNFEMAQRNKKKDWRFGVSIPVPHRCERCALPIELNPLALISFSFPLFPCAHFVPRCFKSCSTVNGLCEPSLLREVNSMIHVGQLVILWTCHVCFLSLSVHFFCTSQSAKVREAAFFHRTSKQ